MADVYCFEPIADSRARALILGSMPGNASLKAGRYYAHPGNAFWRIMAGILNAPGDPPYAARARLLKRNGIALWDVINSCARRGSADSDIKRKSITPNDFRSFFLAHPDITDVFFNGAKAAECYERHVKPALPKSRAALKRHRLPSTSPAHASLSYPQKYRRWKKALYRFVRRGDEK